MPRVSENYAIVADIGGTNARFCRVELNSLTIDQIKILSCADYRGIEDAWIHYLETSSVKVVSQAAIAIACPVNNEIIRMTNSHWQFSRELIKQKLDLKQLYILNDFTATAMCLPVLAAEHRLQIGNGLAESGQNKLVLGAGTGLGVAQLISSAHGFMPLAGEGGHADWAVQTEQEWFIHQYLSRKYGHVSSERILSGTGLEDIYTALAAYHGKREQSLSAAEIAQMALSNSCSLASAVVKQFFASLGGFAGNLALTTNAFGGVYLAGGIVPKLLPLLVESEFRERFEDKGRFREFNQKIATFVITAEQPGLLGAAAYLKQRMVEDGFF
ncbi:glucokinase [Legionella birminghamensis]|uniref:Glucokinase n=1 Tax=Legionella birminghamensis TaxID=28083 RepID=A0A378I9I1_9GAMM|nr:glucokinase [Legionella birminghamensis]KTC68929.1 glucokinase [Legionella birminghamensis]STX31445.1 glucokinase [Legionella birminghamensis]